ncbi:MAG TPA: type II secretion system protein GspN [Polyangiaceae bacterium]|nr:type II secretion system protein GspN [Polyangiaceae bacterium]
MTPRLIRILRWVGYPLFYVFALLLFTYLTFPYDRLRDRLVGEINAKPISPGMQVKIDTVDSYWFSGVEAEGVQLISPPSATAGEDGKPAKPKTVTLEQMHARVSLLRLLVGTLHVSFGADALGGEISGYTSDADDARTVTAELDGVRVGDLPVLTDIVGLPLTGALTGEIDLKLPEGKFAKAEGKIALKFTDLAIGDGKAKIMNTIALPTLNVGELVLEGEATDGRLDITKFSAGGRDLELVSDGRIRLRDPFTASLAELNLRFKFSPAYRNRNDTTRALFGAPGSTVPAVFDLDPKVRRAKRPDEFYAWRLTGPLARMNFEPAALAGGAAGGRNPLGAPPSGFANDDDSE